MFEVVAMKLMGKKRLLSYFHSAIIRILSSTKFMRFFSPSICMNFHSGANTGATTLTLARFFLTKVIFVFLYLNICYLNDMLVYRLTIHQQKYFYFREDIQNETRLHTAEVKLRFWWTGLVQYQRSGVF